MLLTSYDQLIGKTIAEVTELGLVEYDDTGFLRLTFTDNTRCIVAGCYGGYTEESEGEYRTVIQLVDEDREAQLRTIV